MDGFWVTDIEGEIPKEMHGTYFKFVFWTSLSCEMIEGTSLLELCPMESTLHIHLMHKDTLEA